MQPAVAAETTHRRPRPYVRATAAATPDWVDREAFGPWVALWDESYDASDPTWTMGPDGVLLPGGAGPGPAAAAGRLVRRLVRRG